MPSACSAFNCSNRSNKTVGISYFRFPLKNKELLQRWVANMRRDKWQPTQYSYICSSHFEDRFVYATNDKKRLLANAIPTLFSFPDHLQQPKTVRRPPKKRQMVETPAAVDIPSNEPGEREIHSEHTDHSYCLPSPKKIKLDYDKLQERHQKLKKQMKQAKQCLARKKKQIITYETLVAGLYKRLQDSASEVLGCDKNSDILKQLISLQGKRSIPEYPSEIRQFALTLNFYSAQAYSYLRKFAKLPHPRTLRRWATSVDGSPGFTEESFKKLASEVQNSSGTILATLMFDEVALKKDLVWDGKKVWGYVDLGQGCEGSDDSQVAREALVFMVTALNKSWKIPVGYCLLNGLTASVKLNLVQQYLRKLEETGIQIVAVVCDGAATNRSVMDKLGVKIGILNSQCWFPHPSDAKKRVFCLFDAAHVLKLMRNTLSEKKMLVDGDGQKIKWDYFSSLVNLQEKEGLHAANKIRRVHIHYESQKMKVALAAQTLSNSVANAMIFCRDLGLPEFVGCEGTVTFIKMVDTAFDLLNSCNVMNKGTKSPVFKGNRTTICNTIEKCTHYFMNLKLCDGTLVYLSGRKMGVCGIVVDLMSLRQLAELYVWSDSPMLKFILTRRMSQDHLELFFSCIRRSGGHRNNPNALQFRAAYRKCLITQVDPSKNANSTGGDLETLLLPISNDVFHSYGNDHFDHDYIPQYEILTLYSEKVIEYISGFVIRQVSKKLKCLGCLEVLLSPQTEMKTGLIAVKDVKDSLYNPSKDVIKLLKVAERVLRNCETSMGKKNFLLRLYNDVFRVLGNRQSLFNGFDHLMDSSEFGEESHYCILIKLLLKHYFTCRLHHLCKSKSMENRGKQIRQMYTKLILFKGQ